MQSQWNDQDAQDYISQAEQAGQDAALGLRIYTSRLIGRDPDLVLHGGGNTSVKIETAEGPVIHVKGSGWDLGDIEAPGLPAMWLEPLLKARDIPTMSDQDMVTFLRSNLLDAKSPNPSVEALLHAFLPFDFVDHTHATAVLALADQDDMEAEVARIYGDRVAYVPYVMPGYDLSHACDHVYAANPQAEGLWLAKHGLFTFSNDARESYERMIEFVSLAERELASRNASSGSSETPTGDNDPAFAARLQAVLADLGGLGSNPVLNFRNSALIGRLLAHADLRDLVERGTATPDHVIRNKPFPLILSRQASDSDMRAALSDYAERYRAYFDRNASLASEAKTMLDTLPRAVLVPGLGIYGLGANAAAAAIVSDLWEQTARVILAAEAWGRYTPLNENDLFNMEYWSLEQAKLRKA